MNSSNSLKVKELKNLILIACFVLSPAIAGFNYSIKRYVISSGGGISNGGTYQVRGTIGQAVTAQSSGGSYSVKSGYWQAQSNFTDIIFKNGFE